MLIHKITFTAHSSKKTKKSRTLFLLFTCSMSENKPGGVLKVFVTDLRNMVMVRDCSHDKPKELVHDCLVSLPDIFSQVAREKVK